MSVTAEATRFHPVTAREGAEIEDRRTRLGMSISGLARAAKVDRGRLSALEKGDESVRDTTIGAVKSALDRLEVEMGMDTASQDLGDDRNGDLVEFTIEGNFGVRAVVRGPIRDLDALQEAVGKLVKDMQTGETGSDSPNT